MTDDEATGDRRVASGSTGDRRVDSGPTDVAAVYVHVPFCARRCRYCDFAIQIDRQPRLDAWIRALELEWRAVLSDPDVRVAPRLETLYVGGGTPSLLGPGLAPELARLFGRDRLPPESGEWTIEVNPESFDDGTASAWRMAGVSRLSVGVQSFHEPTLRWMARLHRSDGALEALRRARQAGFSDISIDLIFGLPEHLGRSWTQDLEITLDLDIPHVSLYGLTVETGTPLWKAMRDGREDEVPEERYEAEYLEAAERLTAAGYEHYEVSNFARPGYRARHNPVYWAHLPYLGLGNGAHSYLPPRRRWNLRAWPAYQDALLGGRSPVEEVETVDGERLVLERVWLGLRTAEGYRLPAGTSVGDGETIQSGEEVGQRLRSLLAGWTSNGLARVSGDRLRLTARGWLSLDRLSVDLSDCLQGPAPASGGTDLPG